MRRIRVIPVLLIQNGGLVKSVRFKNHIYVGDPINAVKIFNDKEVDEIVILDISATANKRPPRFDKIKEITGEAFMPLAYGGGITQVDEIKQLINLGVEKVIINSAALTNPKLIEDSARIFGKQSIVVCLDVKKDWLGRTRVYTSNGSNKTNYSPVEAAIMMQNSGAGEIILQSIDKDGTFSGYDTSLIKEVSSELAIPLVALGGAATINDLLKAKNNGASALAAGSMFVFQLPHKAVLITYPEEAVLKRELYI